MTSKAQEPKDLQASVDELFNDQNLVRSNYWKPQKVGDRVQGYLVGKTKKPNTLKEGYLQTIYTLMSEDGTTINVAGRIANETTKTQVLPGLENCKIGQLVGVKFEGEKEHPKAGYNAIKLIKAYAADKYRPDLVEQFKSGGFEALSDDGTPEGTGEPF